MFCLPSGPLAQPWAVIGGNALSALIGVACAHLFPCPDVAAALSLALDPSAALVPVLVNALLLMAAAHVFHKRPHDSLANAPSAKRPTTRPGSPQISGKAVMRVASSFMAACASTLSCSRCSAEICLGATS